MKLNKIALAAALVLGTITTVQAADEGNGVVRFTGSIIDAPCSIDPNSVDQTVELGSVSNVVLVDGGNSAPKPFEIRLEKCSLDTAATVKTTFNGAAGQGGLLGITGDARGAGIALTDGNGTAITLGTATAGQLVSIGASNATLTFSAYLKGNGGDATTIIPGEFSSVANFMLSYN
ncbi:MULTISPECIES: fimbrial protein [Pseudomonas]|uniref:fimbrial protein n=1 Tax=Pseudomonas TaxID=286 RepID=UPI000288B229|nr:MULTISPECIES: fimbrial protein [Pseudomonas]AMB79974.1 fimbria A protein [Pseudomonas fragi]AUB75680.1 fimbria A protein [Pseudomonas sp. Lz4W]NBF16502.1 fimbrial protein [Pseudomonas sp. Fl4BN2]NBG92866.1 type 1 fimbrial protein [Pseudomonas sp. 9.1(2019)]